MKKNVVLVVALLALVGFSAFAQDAESDFHVKKAADGKSIEITKYVGNKTVVNIPSKIQNLPVTRIGQSAFDGKKNITSITIPSSVTYLGQLAFYGCVNLTSITFQGTIDSGKFNDSFDGDLRIKYLERDGGIGTYKVTGKDRDGFAVWTKQGTAATTAADNAGTAGLVYTLIDNGKAYSVKKGTGRIEGAVVIPSTYNNLPVTMIDNFNECGLITDITLPNSITKINNAAFNGCLALTKITIPSSVISIGNMAFNNCANLTSVTFQGTILSKDFQQTLSFPGDLYDKFYATDKTKGTPGTYTRPNLNSTVWTKK